MGAVATDGYEGIVQPIYFTCAPDIQHLVFVCSLISPSLESAFVHCLFPVALLLVVSEDKLVFARTHVPGDDIHLLLRQSVVVCVQLCGNITTGRLAAGESQLVRQPDGRL